MVFTWSYWWDSWRGILCLSTTSSSLQRTLTKRYSSNAFWPSYHWCFCIMYVFCEDFCRFVIGSNTTDSWKCQVWPEMKLWRTWMDTKPWFPNVSFTFHDSAHFLPRRSLTTEHWNPQGLLLSPWKPWRWLWEPPVCRLDNTGALLRRDLMDAGSQPVSSSDSPL